MINDKDYLTLEGANLLASQLRDYWLNRGFVIRTSIPHCISDPTRQVGTIYCFTSNLINGLPPPNSRLAA
jgi:hypothetical protein